MRVLAKNFRLKRSFNLGFRTNFLYLVGIALLVGVALFFLGNPQVFFAVTGPIFPKIQPLRPNIVFIMTDDQDLRSLESRHPNGELILKNINTLLGQQGVNFTNNFDSFSLCCPSRVTLLTGQYAHNHKVLDNEMPWGGYHKFKQLGLENNSLAVWLEQAGYQTIHLGKYVNGYGRPPGVNTAVPPGWNKWFTIFGSLNYYDYFINEEGVIKEFGETPAEYLTDVITEKAVQYLKEQKSSKKPFFMVVDYYAPHASPWGGDIIVPAPRHDNLLTDYNPLFPSSFNEEDVSDKPQKVRNLPLLNQDDIDKIIDARRDGLEALMAVDEGVSQIIETLADAGKLKTTYIIFTSDNGFMFGEHRIPMSKNWPYEESIRTPLLIRGPNIAPGVTISKLTTNVDYAPTILDITKARPGLPQDGRSLMALITNPDVEWRKDFLIETGPFPYYTGVRSENYKYVEYDNDLDGVIDETEFYNFIPDQCQPNEDLYETESQHVNPCYQTLLEEFQQRLSELKNCFGENCW